MTAKPGWRFIERMGKRLGIFVAVFALFLGVTQSALAIFTNSGPFFLSSYNVNVWNWGIGVGPVSGNLTADQLSIPAAYAGDFLDAALVDLGTCLECVGWVAANGGSAEIQVGNDAYASGKITTGVSTRFFTLSGNLGSAQTNTRVTGEYFCGIHGFYYSTPADYSCLSALSGGNGVGWRADGLPAGVVTLEPYSTLAFTTTTCTMSGNTITAMVLVIDPSDAGSGADPNGKLCATDIYNAYIALGGHVGNSPTDFLMGELTVHVYKLSGSDCLTAENNEWGVHSNVGTHCYIAYSGHTGSAEILEHSVPIAWGAQTATASVTLSPALTTSPNTTFLLRTRTLVDGQGATLVHEWNCLLDPSYACPTPPTPGDFPNCFNAPEPGTNESFSDYGLRIKNDGYTGTVVDANDPNYPVGGTGYPDNSDAAALSVGTATGVGSLGTGGSVTMAYVSSTGNRVPATSWRGASICPGTTTEVDVYDVPVGSVGTGGSTTHSSLDFSPITSVSYGSAFPFGIFSWFSDSFSSANCDSETSCNYAPHFTITKPGGGSIFVDLSNSEWTNTYRHPIFLVIKGLILLAAVWFLALRVIGISSGGGEDE